MRIAIYIAAICVLSSSCTTTAYADDNACTIDILQSNLAINAEVVPSAPNRLILESSQADKFLSVGRLVPCTAADLLNIGFEFRGLLRYGPNNSTNGAFEEVSVLQKNTIVVTCYYEFDLSERTRNSRISWSRSACGQIVQPRLVDKK